MMRSVLLAICLLLLSGTVSAHKWGANGHRIVAQICYDNLEPAVRKKIDAALGDHLLVEVANWPDYIKSEKNWSFAGKWHYMTVQPDETVEAVLERGAQNEEIDNVLEAIYLMQAVLKGDQEATGQLEQIMQANRVEPLAGSVEATALAFFLHFIGDIHQPLHVGKNRDMGGNKVAVEFFNERNNLHAVWDSGIIEQEKLSYTEFSLFVEKHHNKQKEAMEQAKPIDWARESIIHRELIYRTLYDKTNRDTGLPSMSWNYQHDFLPLVEQRLAAAGYRAAWFLNSIY